MNAPSQRTVHISPEAKAELRRRILEIVNRKSKLTDIEIWQESAPSHLPWRSMIEEIKALDREKKVRLEIPTPGHWIVHSVENPSPEARPAADVSGKPKSRGAAKGRRRA